MAEHPIVGLMQTAMQSIKNMIDVNTIVGDAVETKDGTIIIPISKVIFGFGVGGSDFFSHKSNNENQSNPFGGGCGTGVTIVPVAFMIVGGGQIKLIPVNPESNIYDKLLEMVPDAIDKLTEGIKKIKTKKSCECPGECGFNDDDESLDFSTNEDEENLSYDGGINKNDE